MEKCRKKSVSGTNKKTQVDIIHKEQRNHAKLKCAYCKEHIEGSGFLKHEKICKSYAQYIYKNPSHGSFGCKICSKLATHRSKLYIHIGLHFKKGGKLETSIRKKKCKICRENVYAGLFPRHSEVCEKIAKFVDNRLECKICYLPSKTVSFAFNHAKTKHFDAIINNKVLPESIRMEEMKKLEKEPKDESSKQRSYKCEYCKDTIGPICRSNFIRHKQNCAMFDGLMILDSTKNYFKDLICNLSFNSRGNLMVHMKKYHKDKRNMNRKMIELRTKQENEQNPHRRNIHQKKSDEFEKTLHCERNSEKKNVSEISGRRKKSEEIKKILLFDQSLHIEDTLESSENKKNLGNAKNSGDNEISDDDDEIKVVGTVAGNSVKSPNYFRKMPNEPGEVRHVFKCQICGQTFVAKIDAQRHVAIFHKICINLQNRLKEPVIVKHILPSS